MNWGLRICAALAVSVLVVPGVSFGEITGDYLEMRTCDVFTGPCFANAEVGLTGRQAVMAWSIEEGQHNGIDLAGLKVVMAINASDTLAYGGGMVVRPDPIKSVILTDAKATAQQREALVDFVKAHAKKVAGSVERVDSAEIAMQLNHVDMTADLKAGSNLDLHTRKLGKGDCVCTNEEIYYPPLTKVDNAAPAYSLTKFAGKGLGTNFSHLGRSAYLATFSYE